MPRHNRGPGEAEECISDDEEQVSSTQTPEQRSEVVAPRPRRRDPSDIQVLREFVEKVNASLEEDKRLNINDSLPEWFLKRPSPLQQTPSQLDPKDNRFDKRNERIFVCDGLDCGNIVKISSLEKKERHTHD